MTTLPRNPTPTSRPENRIAVAQGSRRAVYRVREAGVGYGNSSGYASERRYTRGWSGQPIFRCG